MYAVKMQKKENISCVTVTKTFEVTLTHGVSYNTIRDTTCVLAILSRAKDIVRLRHHTRVNFLSALKIAQFDFSSCVVLVVVGSLSHSNTKPAALHGRQVMEGVGGLKDRLCCSQSNAED
jgi:hypothetical protein